MKLINAVILRKIIGIMLSLTIKRTAIGKDYTVIMVDDSKEATVNDSVIMKVIGLDMELSDHVIA